MQQIITKIETVMTKVIFTILEIVMGIMVIMVVGQVFSRYVLNAPNQYVEEILRFSLIWAVMLGSIACFVINEHIALTLVLDNLKSAKSKKILSVIIDIIVIFFIALVMVYGGVQLSNSTMKQLTPLLRLPMGMVYSIIPISGCFVLLVKFLQVLNTIIEKEGK